MRPPRPSKGRPEPPCPRCGAVLDQVYADLAADVLCTDGSMSSGYVAFRCPKDGKRVIVVGPPTVTKEEK